MICSIEELSFNTRLGSVKFLFCKVSIQAPGAHLDYCTERWASHSPGDNAAEALNWPLVSISSSSLPFRWPYDVIHIKCWKQCFVTWHFFYGEGFLAPRPNPQAGGPPLVGCPRLIIQCIRSSSHSPYLEAISPSATGGVVIYTQKV